MEFKSKLSFKFKTITWAIHLAWKIDAKILVFWYTLSMLLAVLPAVALYFNRDIISKISTYITSGTGTFSEVIPSIVILGLILTIIGLSGRLNDKLLYMMMYDSYYLGMEEFIMEKIQKVELRTLLSKEVKDEYFAIMRRAGSLTDLISSACGLVTKLVAISSLLVVAYSMSKVVFFSSIVFVFTAILLNLVFIKKSRIDTLNIMEVERRANHFSKVPQNLAIAKEMRIYETKGKLFDQWDNAYKRIEKHDKTRVLGRESNSFISGVLFYIFMIAVIVHSIFKVASGIMPVDVFLIIYTLCQSISIAIKDFARSFIYMDKGLFALERQKRFVDSVEEMANTPSVLADIKKETNTIFELKKVSFGYSDEIKVIKNINLSIQKGESIALVGYNGSGKTTLVKLLLDLYKPTEGEILFKGKKYHEFENGTINDQIGVFFQDFYLFHASISDNVGFGDLTNIDNKEKITNAIYKGGADKIVDNLPLGLDNWLGKHIEKEGAILSDGEKHKIAVSRAHMSDKEILIFDEPAAALDPIAEMEQFMKIKEKISGRTSILISHRVGFARLADRIIVMDNGEIKEDGTHIELIKKNGLYAYFFKEQAKWYDNSETKKEDDVG